MECDLKAREYFEEALKSDPYCSRAYTGLSLSYFNEWSCQLWDLWDSSMDNALKYAKKAIELDPNDAISLTVAGRIYLYRGDYEKGEYFLKKSLELNPNKASNLAQIAVSYVYLGKLKKALKYHLKARELDPLNLDSYEAAATLIYFELGEFEKAIESGLKADMDNSWIDLPYMIAGAYFMTGDIDKMKAYWSIYLHNFSERMMKGKKVEPREALDWIVRIRVCQGNRPLGNVVQRENCLFA